MKKIDIYSDTSAYVIGSLGFLIFFVWQYQSLSPGWRFLGMSLISLGADKFTFKHYPVDVLYCLRYLR